MNLLLKILAAVVIVFITKAQVVSARTINYSYDDAGNRILREIVINTQKISEFPAKANCVSDVLAEKTIHIYPNPTKGYLKVEIVEYTDSDSCSMQIFNMDGMQILTILSSEQENDIDLSGYSNGMYILQIYLNGEYTSWKIIKE